jgi:hypothetical protein
MGLGFSPQDLADVVRFVDKGGEGRVTEAQFRAAFRCPAAAPEEESKEGGGEEQSWQCLNCTYMNSVFDSRCAICKRGTTGLREPGENEWSCANCSFFNPQSEYYCEMCSVSRPQYASVRF